MRSLLSILFCWTIFSLTAQDTFSIVAYDADTGEIGSAGASCLDDNQFPGSGGVRLISDIIPGRGAINTQSFYIESNQIAARNRLLAGDNATEIITWITRNDAQFNPAVRQYGIVTVDENGVADAAAFTGAECFDWKGDRVGNGRYAIQGNILLGEEIVNNMEVAFNRTVGTLADKLMAVMQAAKIPGADTRCLDEGVSSLSAYLRVAKPTDSEDDLYLDLNVPATPFGEEPIDELQRLYDEFLITNIAEVNSLEVTIFPNPVQSALRVQLPTGITQLQVFDAQGRRVIQQNGSTSELTIDTQAWTKGVYFIRINRDLEQAIYQRVVKM